MLSATVLQPLLVGGGYIPEAEFTKAVQHATKHNASIEETLVDLGLIEEAPLGHIIADHYQVPFANLRGRRFDQTIVRLVPETLARTQRLVLYEKDEQQGLVALVNPADRETVNALERYLGFPVKVAYAANGAIEEALHAYQKGLHEEFAQLVKAYMAQLSAPAKTLQPLRADDVPVVQIVETIMKYAYQSRASDVHFEPVERDVAVRFRIDGILGDVVTLPHDIYELLVMRIKVLAQLRTDEHLAAQDGKLRFKTQDEEIDVRVSIVPIVHGEKIVLRLLSQKQRKFTLEDLGMQADDLRKVREASLLPHGMILATGPTGSGKTTSLYAILKILNTRDVNISTIEDPVEYYIEGVNHIQVNPRTNLTFALGLRALVRQDPDIIMVGEIRDAETANIAVNAALTGHLVLSSVHTNDAATTLPRLLDMEVEPFLAASSVNVAVGQRLVRRICAECRATAELSDHERETILRLLPPASTVRTEVQGRPRVYKGVGCAACNNLGYLGRIGIYEVLIVDDPIRELIIQRASAVQLRDQAIKGGMTTMLEDGISKVLQGITTVEEVLRAAKE